MKKIIGYGIWVLSLFSICFIHAHAEESMVFYQYDTNYRSKIVGREGFFEFVIYTIDGTTGYSLDATKNLINIFGEKDEAYLNKYSKEQIEYLEKIAHFGYDYDQSDKIRYMAAQEIIWEYVSNIDVYWVDRDGFEIDIEAKKQEIILLANTFGKVPDFGSNPIAMNYFDEITLVDQNGVLGAHQIQNNSLNKISKKGTKLTIQMKEDQPTEIKLFRQFPKTKSVVFHVENSPDIATFGMSGDYSTTLSIIPTSRPSSYLEIQFQNQNQNVKEKISFQVKSETEEWSFETNEEGYFLSDMLFTEGDYEIKTNNTNHYASQRKVVSIHKNTIDDTRKTKATVSLKESLGSLKITRLGKTIFDERPIADVTYQVYAKEDLYQDGKKVFQKDDLVAQATTNEKGIMQVENLPRGTYIVREQSLSDYVFITKEMPITLDDTCLDYQLELLSLHLPIEITLTGSYPYDMYLKDQNGKVIKTLTYGKLEEALPFGTYSLQVEKEGKRIYSFALDFSKENRIFAFHLEEMKEPILFEMPKTGRILSHSFGCISMLFYLMHKKR